MQYATLPNYISKLFQKLNNYKCTTYHNDIVYSIVSYVLPNSQEMYFHHTTICYRLGILLQNNTSDEKREILHNGIMFFKKIHKGGLHNFKNSVNTLSKILLISLHNNTYLIYNVIDIEPYIINTKDLVGIIPFSNTDELYHLYYNEIKYCSKLKPLSIFYFCNSILSNKNKEHIDNFNIKIPKLVCQKINSIVKDFQDIYISEFKDKSIFNQLFELFNHCLEKENWIIDDAYKIDILLHLFARSKIIYYHKFDKLAKKELDKYIDLTKFLIINNKFIEDEMIIVSSYNKNLKKINKKSVCPYNIINNEKNINILCHNIGGASYDINYHIKMYKNTFGFNTNIKNSIMCFQEVSNKNIKNTFNQTNSNFQYVNCYFLVPETLTDYCKNNYRYGRLISNIDQNTFVDVKNTMYEKNLHLQNEINTISNSFSNLSALNLIRKFSDKDPKWFIIRNIQDQNLPQYDDFIRKSYKKNVVNMAKNKIMIHRIENSDLYYVYCDERLNIGKDISKHQLMIIFPESFFDPTVCKTNTHFIIGNLRNTLGHMFIGLKNTCQTECIINTHLQSGDQFGTKDGIAMNEFINLMNVICGSRHDDFFKNINTIYIVGDFNLNSDIMLMIFENSIKIHKNFKNHKIYFLFDNVKTHTNYERRNSQDSELFDVFYNKLKNKPYLVDTDISWIQNELSKKDITEDQYENLLNLIKNKSDIKQKGCIDNIIVITNSNIDNINLGVGHRKSTIKTAKQFEMIYKGDDILKLKNLKFNENRLDLQNINQLAQYFLSDHSPIYTSIRFKKMNCMDYLKRFLPI